MWNIILTTVLYLSLAFFVLTTWTAVLSISFSLRQLAQLAEPTKPIPESRSPHPRKQQPPQEPTQKQEPRSLGTEGRLPESSFRIPMPPIAFPKEPSPDRTPSYPGDVPPASPPPRFKPTPPRARRIKESSDVPEPMSMEDLIAERERYDLDAEWPDDMDVE